MGKRIKFIINTPESVTLKRLREKSGLSLRQLADRMDISFSRVHQRETGRDEISKDYVSLFLKAIGLNYDDWEYELNNKSAIKSKAAQTRFYSDTTKFNQCAGDEKTRIECLKIITQLSNQKLEVALVLLTNIA